MRHLLRMIQILFNFKVKIFGSHNYEFFFHVKLIYFLFKLINLKKRYLENKNKVKNNTNLFVIHFYYSVKFQINI